MPHLERITIHPVKSLDGIEVEEATVLPCGALENDRRWRLVDEDGRVVNAKRTPRIQAIRAEFALDRDGEGRTIGLRFDPAAGGNGPAEERFELVPGPSGPCSWLSAVHGIAVLLEERASGGVPDDRDAAGATFVSTAALAEVARWFALPIDEARRRFRMNLEVAGCDPFWEDTLAHPLPTRSSPALGLLGAEILVDPWADLPPAPPVSFVVGAAGFRAVNACRRCPVPARDSRSGIRTDYFQEAFEARRRRGSRRDVDASAWQGYYRLGINTVGDGRGGNVQVGDRIAPVAHPGVS